MRKLFQERLKAVFASAGQKIREPLSPVINVYNKYLNYSVVNMIWLALFCDLVIESLNHGGFLGCLSFIARSPHIFLYDGLILLATLSVGLFFKRRVFICFVIAATWLILGTANGVILSFRTTPFTTADLTLLETGLGVLPNYLSNWEIALIVAAIIVLVIVLVLLFLFAPKCKNYSLKKSLVSFLAIILILAGATQYGLTQNWISTIFVNLNYAYRDYGFPYCFINTWLNTGVRMPQGYSEEMMKGITDEIRAETDANMGGLLEQEQKTPNIVFVQLESFFDPTTISRMSFSEDPLPNWHRLEQEYSKGYLLVPVIGAGTANTEFEVMTGMRSRFFGPGEYPFKTILTDHTVESVAYNLKNLGYGTHAIHNHRGVFYGRNKVYANLGYDTYTSLEYMLHAKMNPRNWAKDDVLTEEIVLALNSTVEKDLVFTISVQGHGKYPTSRVYVDPPVTVEGVEDQESAYAWEYYVNQIHEMDAFVGDLTDTLSEYDEDTVVVFYGDHLPNLGITAEDVECGDIYSTPYLIWSNFHMRKIDTDLRAYQLSATLMGRLGIEEGLLTKFHETQQGKTDYLDRLQALQYDMLYGKRYVYGQGAVPYEPTDMKMGILPIRITDAFELDGHVYVKGQNFTAYSKVTLDGQILDTVYLNSSTLRVPDGTDISRVEDFKISQVEKNKAVLSTTE